MDNGTGFKLLTYPARKFYVYVDAAGSHYLPSDAIDLEQLADIPEDVSCFEFSIQMLPAKASIHSQAVLQQMALEQQSGRVRARTQDVNEFLFRDIVASLQWNLVDTSGVPVPVNLETLSDLQPGWLLEKIAEGHVRVNKPKN